MVIIIWQLEALLNKFIICFLSRNFEVLFNVAMLLELFQFEFDSKTVTKKEFFKSRFLSKTHYYQWWLIKIYTFDIETAEQLSNLRLKYDTTPKSLKNQDNIVFFDFHRFCIINSYHLASHLGENALRILGSSKVLHFYSSVCNHVNMCLFAY